MLLSSLTSSRLDRFTFNQQLEELKQKRWKERTALDLATIARVFDTIIATWCRESDGKDSHEGSNEENEGSDGEHG